MFRSIHGRTSMVLMAANAKVGEEMPAVNFPKVSSIKSPEALRERMEQLGIALLVDDEVQSGPK